MLLHRESRSQLARIWRRLTFTAAACALAMIVACARESPAQPPPTAVATASQLYERACARCHGTDGSGGLPMVPGGPQPIDLRGAEWQASRSDVEIHAAIRDGRGAMPPFEDVLDADQIAALTAYVRQLGASAPPSR